MLIQRRQRAPNPNQNGGESRPQPRGPRSKQRPLVASTAPWALGRPRHRTRHDLPVDSTPRIIDTHRRSPRHSGVGRYRGPRRHVNRVVTVANRWRSTRWLRSRRASSRFREAASIFVVLLTCPVGSPTQHKGHRQRIDVFHASLTRHPGNPGGSPEMASEIFTGAHPLGQRGWHQNLICNLRSPPEGAVGRRTTTSL